MGFNCTFEFYPSCPVTVLNDSREGERNDSRIHFAWDNVNSNRDVDPRAAGWRRIYLFSKPRRTIIYDRYARNYYRAYMHTEPRRCIHRGVDAPCRGPRNLVGGCMGRRNAHAHTPRAHLQVLGECRPYVCMYTHMHSLGRLQCPCCSSHPGRQRAEMSKKKSKRLRQLSARGRSRPSRLHERANALRCPIRHAYTHALYVRYVRPLHFET